MCTERVYSLSHSLSGSLSKNSTASLFIDSDPDSDSDSAISSPIASIRCQRPVIFQHLSSMDRRTDVWVGHQHFSVRPHEIGDAFGKWDQSACGSDRLRQLVVAVAEKAEWKSVLFGKLPVPLRAVIGNAEHFDFEFLEFVPAVPQLVGFQRSTGGAGLWIEEKEERTTFEVGARYRGTVLGLEFEIDKRLSDWNHLTSCSVSDRNEHRNQNRYQ